MFAEEVSTWSRSNDKFGIIVGAGLEAEDFPGEMSPTYCRYVQYEICFPSEHSFMKPSLSVRNTGMDSDWYLSTASCEGIPLIPFPTLMTETAGPVARRKFRLLEYLLP